MEIVAGTTGMPAEPIGQKWGTLFLDLTVSRLFATFLIPAKPAVDNLDVHPDVHLETVPEVHEQVLTQQSLDCLVTPAVPAIRKEPAEPAAKYTQESNWTSCWTPAEPAITEEPTEPVAKYI